MLTTCRWRCTCFDSVDARHGIDPTKAVTLISAAGFAEPDLLLEIEAVAVLA